MKKLLLPLLLFIFLIPTFFRMLASGIYSMQDFHLFRLYEFDKCVAARQIPCRWAPDAGLGYGEPLFNFYAQAPYAIGEIFHLAGFSFIDSVKLLFIISLMGSGISMYFLAKHLWKNEWAGIVSALIYVYAPYRAVDVWVRGALPEALSFILFPLLILSIEKRKTIWLSFLLALLVLTHNLSLVMFLPLIIVWIIYRKFWQGIPAGILAVGLSTFYILPVVFESQYIQLGSTTSGYFDFRAHFLTLKQIFFNFYWGYGASTWGDSDGLNLSVGIVQWILPAVLALWLVFKKKLNNMPFIILILSGLFYLFLTHNKSTFIWESLPFMKYIQFPWRFLGLAVFSFSLASGKLVNLINKKISLLTVGLIAILAMVSTASYFRPDIWYGVSDSYFLTGAEWDRQRAASIGDFWPNFGHQIPSVPSDGKYINYFPGWVGALPDKNGLIPNSGTTFTDTSIVRVGNIISLMSFGFLVFWALKGKMAKVKA